MAKVDKNGQTKPQYPESYTKGADKEKKAKPVGYRYTNKLAKQLGIKDPSKKPTAADIEKYLGRKKNGKYVYSERRKNKSDVNPKNKLAKGGKTAQNYPQSENYNEFRDLEKKAKPVGYRYNKEGLKALRIKNPYAKPTQAHIEKYLDEYVYWENRADKSDQNPKQRLAKGGKTAQNYPQSENYNEFRDLEKKAKPVGYRYNKDGLKALRIKNPYAVPTQAHIEKYKDEYVYWENRADKSDQNPKQKLEDGGEMAKGGKTKKFLTYYEIYDENTNKTLNIQAYSFKEAEEIASTIEFDNFKDDEDIEYGEMAKGGKVSKSKILDLYNTKKSFSGSEEKKIDEAIENGYLDTDDIKEDFLDFLHAKLGTDGLTFSDDEIWEYTDEQYENGKTHHENYRQFLRKKDGKYARGGQAPSYKQTYFGYKWREKADKEEKAKRVGYRYKDTLAKRLGVNKYAKPTDAHIEKYLGKGIYFENRKDKSDLSPKDKLAKGGTTKQTYAQDTDTYNEFRDLTKTAKPVGYRYNKRGLKALRIKNPYAKPTQAHIEKYLDEYVYWENRADKSDQNPKQKLEDGGEMARGGQARISNSEASSYAENHQPFKGNNLEAKTLENGDYVVLSYGYYPIWYWNKKEDKWYQNKDKFSQTTARHITASRPTYDAQVVSRNEMDNMMAKSLEGNGFMALGGELSSFVVTQ